MLEKILPIMGLVFVCIPALWLIWSILRYNFLNKKNIPLQLYGLFTIIAGILVCIDKIYTYIMKVSLLGFTGYTICLTFLFVLTLIYAMVVYSYREIEPQDDFRPTILATSILMFACFVFYIVNSILHIIAYNYIVEYLAFIFMLISAMGLGFQKRKIKKYCKKNSIEYKVLTSRKPDDREFNVFWLEVEQEQVARNKVVFNKADYEKMKIKNSPKTAEGQYDSDEEFIKFALGEDAVTNLDIVEKELDKEKKENQEEEEINKGNETKLSRKENKSLKKEEKAQKAENEKLKKEEEAKQKKDAKLAKKEKHNDTDSLENDEKSNTIKDER